MGDRVDVQRVNVLTPSGQALAGRLHVDFVPLVLLYDLTGHERYRASGLAVRPGAMRRVLDTMAASEQAGKRGNEC